MERMSWARASRLADQRGELPHLGHQPGDLVLLEVARPGFLPQPLELVNDLVVGGWGCCS